MNELAPKNPTLQIGQQIFTKDGRCWGNAIVVGHERHPELGDVWEIETDFGNKGKLTTAEVRSAWHVEPIDHPPVITHPAHWRRERAELRGELDTWRPISTAPKDGSHIIVIFEWASVDIVRLCWWNDGSAEQNGGEADPTAVGWWSYKHSVTQEHIDWMAPVGWMPTPAKRDIP
jgi:hypothetical protein